MTDKEFEQALKDHIKDSLNFCNWLTKDVNEAELLKSQALERAWKWRNTFDSSKAKFKTWLFTIIKNTSIDIYRATPKVYHFPIEGDWDHPVTECNEDKYILESMIRNITYTLETEFSAHEVKLFKMSIYEGYKYREVAERYNISINTLKVLVHRIRIYLSDPKNIKVAPESIGLQTKKKRSKKLKRK